VISVMAVNFSGIVAANTVNGVFRAMARGDSGKGNKNTKKKLIAFQRKNKGKPTCGKDGFVIQVVFILLPGEPWWSGHWEI